MINRKPSNMRAQSAMEYLMTYGWAILIIAVVLAALFSLGVFSGGNGLGTSCLAGSPFSCTSPVLTTTGNVQFTFGQSSGSTWYNVEFTCLSSANSISTGWSSGATSPVFTPLTVGPANVIPPGVTNTLYSGQSVVVGVTPGNGIQCYGATGAIGPQNIGSSFTGTLWLNYTTGPAAATGTNPWLSARVGTLTLRTA